MTKYSKNKQYNKKDKKKVLLVACSFIAILLVLLGSYLFVLKKQKSSTETNTNNDYVNLDPPSEGVVKETEENKKQLANNNDATKPGITQPGQSETPDSIKPVIIDASQYGPTVEVRAFAPNIFEENGNCVITFTKAGSTVSKTVGTYLDASTTHCNNLDLATSELTNGVWNVTVRYSGSLSGASDPQTMEINNEDTN